jgi:hypothetical protein
VKQFTQAKYFCGENISRPRRRPPRAADARRSGLVSDRDLMPRVGHGQTSLREIPRDNPSGHREAGHKLDYPSPKGRVAERSEAGWGF